MCSFIFSNYHIENLDSVNFFNKMRGPDTTSICSIQGWHFIHNLLSITGKFTEQPFKDESSGISCMYNGEIYNAEDMQGNCSTDGVCLIPLYKKYGLDFVSKLDGEYAIVLADFLQRKIVVAADTFATKPVWIGFHNEMICVASYESVLKKQGFIKYFKVPANSTYIINMDTREYQKRTPVRKFDVSAQHKMTYDDWILTFSKSIEKRTRSLKERVFIALSSGYDSGAIACELMNQHRIFTTYSIVAQEHIPTLQQRHAIIQRANLVSKITQMSNLQYDYARNQLKSEVEEFQYQIIREDGKVTPDEYLTDDKGAIGLAHICSLARAEGCRIFLSGQGADEIISDYGFNGLRMAEHSNFGGKFPDNLTDIFPWDSFYNGTQISYLAKEEHVTGAFGIEGRYPFLDFDLVQEFLWLHPTLKNQYYKAPLHEYLNRTKFPFCVNQKIGFSCDKGLI